MINNNPLVVAICTSPKLILENTNANKTTKKILIYLFLPKIFDNISEVLRNAMVDTYCEVEKKTQFSLVVLRFIFKFIFYFY